ncbi:RNA polymerase II-associated [Limtongia smithiae]|uniref:RNA polymerase II-associated n=1 Tax=Limtongia smithiae TaxID=1125753 RepID=UPI0034CF6865
MSRAVRQDYIARVRYQNGLPPPPCPPKLLDVPIPLSSFTHAGFLSALVQQQPPNIDIDAELGMPLDMTMISGVFDKGDESKLYPERGEITLHDTDRLLLRDPFEIGGSSKSQPSVAFLRRTEYISTDAVKQARALRTAAAATKAAERAAKVNDPQQQLEAIEQTFEQAKEDITVFRHPTKKNLTVVDSWDVVPDIEMFDRQYLLMKMAGSAPGMSGKDETSDSRYDVAVARPMGTETQTFMSMFLADADTSEKLKQAMSLSQSEAAEELLEHDDDNDESGEMYRFEYTRDYEITSQDTDEMLLSIDDETQKAYFHPIGRRVILKRRRMQNLDKKRRPEENITNDVAAIEIKFRALTAEEKVNRDSVRKQEFGYMAE